MKVAVLIPCCNESLTIEKVVADFRFYRPFAFFGSVGFALALVAVGLMAPVLRDYFRTGLVPRFPTLICACFVLTASLLSFGIALVLDAVKKQSDQSFERALANA